ncbi:AAA family ATPase [Actinoplanes sp. TBRC 11911]|uniref:helix-turn-helix transcriptional regulator n=1 Tax=Actinoplanes sp. TBRC 11911 TaxID=2729386 RepID=UPI00145FB6E9|nr:LuxR family transcriptional regulator [Actinoplanes sp. TBRC 11911]NMO57532.1 AAA family ATPase [Actinoplanes sp. TBRC 11911]
MSTTERAPVLRGRRSERETLDELLTSLRAGRSQVLVLSGEAGIGKTALLEYLVSRAAECRVARATGAEFEMELAYAGLHQLCAPFLNRLDRLPAPQRDALGTAFGLHDGNAPDRFLVGLAVLSLLSDVAQDKPLICLVDDAQWLDRASADTLAFVARRLLAESVALVFACRTPGVDEAFRQLPTMVVGGLGQADSRALLQAALAGPLEAGVLDRIVAEAHGNPLALLELPRGRTPAQLAFGLGLHTPIPLAGHLEQGFVTRLQALPAETRRLLLVAALEPVGDVTALRRTAERLGIPPSAAVPAEQAGLIEFGVSARFRHPLVRSAAWRSADVRDLVAVHRALAEATELSPDRRAWHRAEATSEPDEEAAAELERSADRARARGGFAAAAAFLERAAGLSPDPARRAVRVLSAAQAKLQAGEFNPALQLLATAEAGPIDDLGRARIDMLRARIAYASRRGSEAPALLLAAARRLEPLDIERARVTYLEVVAAALYMGRFSVPDLMEVAASVPRTTPDHSRKRDILLAGLTSLITDGHAVALPTVRRALQAYSTEDVSIAESLESLSVTSVLAADVWDDDGFRVLSGRYVQTARDAGALGELLRAITIQVIAHALAGELEAATALVDEAKIVMDTVAGDRPARPMYAEMVLASWQGREQEARRLIDASLSDVVANGEGTGVSVAQWAAAALFNGLGRYEEAMAAARQASAYLHELAASKWGLAELIESATRSGATDVADEALHRLSEMTGAVGTEWALGIEARSRALLAEGETAERLYREAIERLGRTQQRAEYARARLLYGEWLRREGRRLDAREQLRAAYDLFTAMGAQAFGERARQELHATGETAQKRTIETRSRLTPQEAQIARLAARHLTNSEIGAQLFISARTVEWHMRKVFTKLGISSRRELPDALPDAA